MNQAPVGVRMSIRDTAAYIYILFIQAHIRAGWNRPSIHLVYALE